MMMAAMIVSSARNMPNCLRDLVHHPLHQQVLLAGLGEDRHVAPGGDGGRHRGRVRAGGDPDHHGAELRGGHGGQFRRRAREAAP